MNVANCHSNLNHRDFKIPDISCTCQLKKVHVHWVKVLLKVFHHSTILIIEENDPAHLLSRACVWAHLHLLKPHTVCIFLRLSKFISSLSADVWWHNHIIGYSPLAEVFSWVTLCLIKIFVIDNPWLAHFTIWVQIWEAILHNHTPIGISIIANKSPSSTMEAVGDTILSTCLWFLHEGFIFWIDTYYILMVSLHTTHTQNAAWSSHYCHCGAE